MKNFKIRAACGILIAALGITGLTGCGSLNGTATVVTVNDHKVPVGVVNFSLRYTQAQNEYMYKMFAQMYGGSSENKPVWDEKTEDGKTRGQETKEEVLETLEKMYLVRDHAEEYGVALTEEEKTAITEAAKAFIAANTEETLKQLAVSQADVEEYMELNTIYEKAFDPMVADVEVEVKDEEAAQSTITYSFLSTSKDMDDATKAEVKAKMESLLAEYKAQENIADFDMKAFTEAKDDNFITSTSSFGEEKEDTTLQDEVIEAAKTLQDGQLYDGVVEADSGYFVIRMDHVLDQEATDKKREEIKSEKLQEAFDKLVQGWLDDATVSVDKGTWKKIKLTDKESYSTSAAEAGADESAVETEAAEETPAATDAPAEETPAATDAAAEETPVATDAPAEETPATDAPAE